jgi:hypothetical protein
MMRLTKLDINDSLEYMNKTYYTLYTTLHPVKPNPGRVPNKSHITAISKARQKTPSGTKLDSCLVLSALATHISYQGQGIASYLVRWGMDLASSLKLPLHVGGEEQGAVFYEKALGFRRLPKSEYWLDAEGEEVTKEEVEMGDERWRVKNGGVSGCDLIWCPAGVRVDEDGFVVKREH